MTTEPEYTIDDFRPEDAEGVVALYRAVYGENYPIRSVYDAREIIRQEESHETYRMVARSPAGEIVGHVAVYHSVPPAPNQELYEAGQLMVRPDYRQTAVAFELIHACISELPQKYNIGLWGEAVCNHLFTQQMMARERFVETGLEMDLMPESSYSLPTSQAAGGRVSVIFAFRVCSPHPRTLYLPSIYAESLTFIYEEVKDEYTIALSDAGLPPGTRTKGTMELFKEAGVARITISAVGSDLSDWIGGHGREAAESGIIVTQVFMPLTVPWTGAAVDILRKHGYFIGGALLRWFGGDGLLMQKHAGTPNFDGAHMYTKRAKRIKELVLEDWKAVTEDRRKTEDLQ